MQGKIDSFPITEWAEDDKPREKLATKGRRVLSDAELIAILIGSGNKEESAVDLAKRILASAHHSLNELGTFSLSQLKQFKGIGEAKAIAIAAAMEIGRRRKGANSDKISKIKSSTDAFEELYPLLGELNHEEFWILYLNNANKVIHKSQLSKGGITGTLVDVRLVLKEALELGAVGLILAHNHPSGNLNPSTPDEKITKKLKIASEAMDIKVLDHLILSGNQFFSFADQGML